MFIQFDVDILDEAQLLADLRAAGIDARSVRNSRWVRIDALTGGELDAGPRLDVELKLEARTQALGRIAQLEAFMRSRVG